MALNAIGYTGTINDTRLIGIFMNCAMPIRRSVRVLRNWARFPRRTMCSLRRRPSYTQFSISKLAPETLQKRAQWRRDWWYRVKELEPSPLLKGNLPYERDSGPSTLADGDFSGVGGAPGVVVGPVRVVKVLNELGSVAQGDILVTHAIDPAWTPVFGTIGGVISEEGGILSHATVLGREYGLPVVIGVAGAASSLKNGDLVEVNGTRGTVRRLGPSANSAIDERASAQIRDEMPKSDSSIEAALSPILPSG